jgi:acetolactate synthase-1/2/3 large subunit
MRIVKPEDVVPSLRRAMDVKDLPVVMDFVVDPEEKVLPMVPAGASLMEMLE